MLMHHCVSDFGQRLIFHNRATTCLARSKENFSTLLVGQFSVKDFPHDFERFLSLDFSYPRSADVQSERSDRFPWSHSLGQQDHPPVDASCPKFGHAVGQLSEIQVGCVSVSKVWTLTLQVATGRLSLPLSVSCYTVLLIQGVLQIFFLQSVC